MSFDDEIDAMKAARAERFDPPFIRASSFAGKPVPERRWIVPEWIPDRTVTLLGGDGGTGKSLIALQLAFAMATETAWLGMQVASGPVIYVTAEDDTDELMRRLDDINRNAGCDFHALDRLTLRSMAGFNALLAIEAEGTLATAKAFDEVEQVAADERPALIVLDTLADFFPSNENDRAKVRAFIGILRGLALRQKCGLLMLAHPSVAGMTSGTGLSGSTAWNNSVRSRLYFERVIEDGHEPDPDARRLSNKKSNYGRTGLEIALRWQDGVFLAQDGGSRLDHMAATAKAERVFLKLLKDCNDRGQRINSNAGNNYAPAFFSGHPGSEGVTKRAFRTAMQSLLHQGAIEIEKYGPASKPRTHLVVAK